MFIRKVTMQLFVIRNIIYIFPEILPLIYSNPQCFKPAQAVQCMKIVNNFCCSLRFLTTLSTVTYFSDGIRIFAKSFTCLKVLFLITNNCIVILQTPCIIKRCYHFIKGFFRKKMISPKRWI